MKTLLSCVLLSSTLVACSHRETTTSDQDSVAVMNDTVKMPVQPEAPLPEPGLYPFTSHRVLEESEISYLEGYELRIMRNDIFARLGYIFKSADLAEEFRRYPWYHPQYENVDSMLTEIEKRNINLLVKRERIFQKEMQHLIATLPVISLPLDIELVNPYFTLFDEGNPPRFLDDGMAAASWEALFFSLIFSELPTRDNYVSYRIEGLLPDTTTYYGIIWASPVPGEGLVSSVTTLDKQFNVIDGGSIQLPPGLTEGQSGACRIESEGCSSVFEADYTFISTCYVSLYCDQGSEEVEPYTEGRQVGIISGRINEKGEIVWEKNNF